MMTTTATTIVQSIFMLWHRSARGFKSGYLRYSGSQWLMGSSFPASNAQLHPIVLFLGQELNCQYAILLKSTIELAAINSERGGRLNLISAELPQYRQNISSLDFGKRDTAVSIRLQHF